MIISLQLVMVLIAIIVTIFVIIAAAIMIILIVVLILIVLIVLIVFVMILVGLAMTRMLVVTITVPTEAINNMRLIAADRSESQRISAKTKFDVSGGLKGRKRTFLLIASRNFRSGDDDLGDDDNIGNGADADSSDRSDCFSGSGGKLGDGRGASGGGGDAGRSYKQHAADRGGSRRIAADLRDNKI